jgi:hypothetical protein
MELGTVSAIALAKQHVRGVFQLSEKIIAAAAFASWDTIRK